MPSSNHASSSRKASGSSAAHSVVHTQAKLTINVSDSRKLAQQHPFFGVAMGSGNGLKTLNSGWQVWANSGPASRNASVSSAVTMPDVAQSQPENGYRSSLGDTWNNGRASGGSWDEDVTTSMQLHATRQRQPANNAAQPAVLSTPSIGLSKLNQYSPQRYEHSAQSTPSRYSAHSPTRTPYPKNTSPLSGQQPLMPSNHGSPSAYETSQASSIVDHDLALTFRGMAVEDEFSSAQPYRQQVLVPQSALAAGQPHTPPSTHMRGPHPMQQPRGPYPGYPQADYVPYYTGPSRVEYPFAYEGYRPGDNMYASSPALSSATPNVYPGMAPHPHPVTDMHNQQYYDYSGSVRPPSQFYYASQPMMYHTPHSPVVGTMKKRAMQFNPQQPQQLPPQTLIYPNLMYMHGAMNPAIQAQQASRSKRQEDANAAFRSQLLEEFRNDKTRKWELKDIFGYVVEFSNDQHGSRFIQQKLETATEEDKQVIFDEIVPHSAMQLIQGVFGNYVVQKLFEYGTPIQKTLLTNVVEGHILPLSLQMYGCRVVQKAIENVTPEQQSIFVKELTENVLQCVKDANGNHVIQRLIERVPPERLDFVKSFRGNVYDLSTHPYGCRVLQRCFEHLPEEQTRPLLDELHKYTIHLMQDQFGNYVIQFVLEHGQPQDRALIISKLRGQMLNMSRHKFASNVCEKALVMADSESRHMLLEEIMTPKHDGVSPVLSMMKDQFANYVLQRALSVVEGEQKNTLVNMVRPHLVSMRKYSSHSRHLIAIERLLEKCTSSGPAIANKDQTENAATADASSSH